MLLNRVTGAIDRIIPAQPTISGSRNTHGHEQVFLLYVMGTLNNRSDDLRWHVWYDLIRRLHIQAIHYLVIRMAVTRIGLQPINFSSLELYMWGGNDVMPHRYCAISNQEAKSDDCSNSRGS